MSQLIRFGEHNDQTITRLHTLSVQLVRTEEATDAIRRTLSALETSTSPTPACACGERPPNRWVNGTARIHVWPSLPAT